MKAIIYNKYGSPANLKLIETKKPIHKDDEILIKIYASSINSADLRMLRANPFFIRLMQGILKPKRKVLGIDFAGKVEAVGKNVKKFKTGDEVFGLSGLSILGAYAEYICLSEDGTIALKPENITYEQAAAVPVAAITALQALRDFGRVKAGQKALINGASGGVGSFAVLIAKAYGTHVTGVCSTRNNELIKNIGADAVIDYKKENFINCGKKFDVIIDVVGNCDVTDYKRLLAKDGACVVIGYTSISKMIKLMIHEKFDTKNTMTIVGMGPSIASKKDLVYLKEVIEEGKIIPNIDRVYNLDKINDAMRYFEDKHARTKVVISVRNNNKK